MTSKIRMMMRMVPSDIERSYSMARSRLAATARMPAAGMTAAITGAKCVRPS
jgi:hypothetical protein